MAAKESYAKISEVVLRSAVALACLSNIIFYFRIFSNQTNSYEQT